MVAFGLAHHQVCAATPLQSLLDDFSKLSGRPLQLWRARNESPH